MKRYFFLFVACLLSVATMAQADRQFIRTGNRYYRLQNFAKAEAEYRKAVAVNGENAQALYNLGCALMMQQKDSIAVEQFQKAGSLEKSALRKAKVYHNIGVVCQAHRIYGDAIKAYEESLRNNPSYDETRYNLALCKRLQKNQKKNQQNQGGGNALAFCAVAAFYLFLLFMFICFRKRWIEKPLVRFLASILLND